MRRFGAAFGVAALLIGGVARPSTAAAPQTGGVMNNRGLFLYYSYVRPEQARRAVRDIQDERDATRDSLDDVQNQLEQFQHALGGYRGGYGVMGLRPESAGQPARLRAATFGRRSPYYPPSR